MPEISRDTLPDPLPGSRQETAPDQAPPDHLPGAPGIVALLHADLPVVLEEVEQLLRRDWPEYADFLVAHREQVCQTGEAALDQFVDVVERARQAGTPLDPVWRVEVAVFEAIGRAQWQAGKRLTTLLSAYQAGARVAWRRFARSAAEQALSAQQVALLAEAVFACVDGLSEASARGYVDEQTGAGEERLRLRAELVEVLLSDRADSGQVEAAATRAGWALPPSVSVVLVRPDDPSALDALVRLGPQCLPVRRAGLLGVLLPVPGPDGGDRRLVDVLAGAGAVVGPPVPLSQLPGALRIAAVAQRLHVEGLLPGDPLLVADHLDAVIVHRDGPLLEVLRSRVLAPLAALPAETRQRLEETLGAWLRHLGNQQAVAAELHVHRQTVRYRLVQLRELFGDALDDPAHRLQLTVALAWRGLREPASPPEGPAGAVPVQRATSGSWASGR